MDFNIDVVGGRQAAAAPDQDTGISEELGGRKLYVPARHDRPITFGVTNGGPIVVPISHADPAGFWDPTDWLPIPHLTIIQKNHMQV